MLLAATRNPTKYTTPKAITQTDMKSRYRTRVRAPEVGKLLFALYLAVIQADIDNSISVRMRRAPNATRFRKFEISWSPAEREFELTY